MAQHLVTGAAGFTGSHMLHTMGETGIIACDILKSDQAATRVQYVERYVLASNLLLDLTRQVDYIHHSAALVQRLGPDVPVSTTYRLFYSFGWHIFS